MSSVKLSSITSSDVGTLVANPFELEDMEMGFEFILEDLYSIDAYKTEIETCFQNALSSLVAEKERALKVVQQEQGKVELIEMFK
jgi:hypothetical protein